MAFVPSGEQIEINADGWSATVVGVGGGIRALTKDGHDVLDGYGIDEMCSAGRGQLLLPWPNRIADGRYGFAGETLQLPLSEPPLRNAIHGLTRWVDWEVLERSSDSVRMGYALRPQPGYPFGLDLSSRFALGPTGLRVTIQATNVGGCRCPFGAGAHPYITGGSPHIDGDIVTVPADVYLVADERQIPVEARPVAGTDRDLRGGKRIGGAVLDTCYTDLRRDIDGRAHVRLEGQRNQNVVLWVDEAFPYVMIYSGDTVHPETRRRQALAVEPMTCAPNAFNSGDGVLVLEPGASFLGTFGIGLE
jgi:aldose 1-epimerase